MPSYHPVTHGAREFTGKLESKIGMSASYKVGLAPIQ